MTYTINITSRAENDLRNIYEYIAFHLMVPKYAIKKIDKLKNKKDAVSASFFIYRNILVIRYISDIKLFLPEITGYETSHD